MQNITVTSISPEIISSLIVAGVTIIGFFVTNLSMKKNFENELRKQRNDIALEHMAKMPLEMLALMNDMISDGRASNNKKKASDKIVNKFNENLNVIYSYGSSNAVRIAATMQQENYHNSELEKLDSKDKYRVMSLFVLLATQIKYDVTGIATSSDEWFRMKLNDYDESIDDIKPVLNQLVRELKLNEEFKI